MFEQFGEFNTVEEMNEAAANQLKEGDREALIALAEENGIDAEDAEDYMEGFMDCLATPMMAAYGKLEVEAKEMKLTEIMLDWYEYIKATCAKSEEMQRAVRQKGKSLKGCIGALLAWSFKHQTEIPKDIIKEAGINNVSKVTIGIPGIGQAKKIITDYYLGA